MLMRLVGAGWLLVTACGAEPAAVSPSEPGQAPATPAVPAAAAPAQSTCTLAAGEGTRAVEVDGTSREYLLHVGETLPQRPAVVFAWHGFGSNAAGALAALDPATFWNDAIVVAPHGLPRTFAQFGDTARPGWQVHAGELDDRDLKFFDAMLADLTALDCVDEARVYTTGFSNGGFVSNVLACHRGEVIAAAAPTGGGGPFVPPCGPKLPVMITHGTEDPVVGFDAATATLAHWATHNGCDPPPSAPAVDRCETVAHCERPVVLCAYAMGHTWPPGQAERTATFLRAQRRAP